MDDFKKRRLADPDTEAAMDEAAGRAQVKFHGLILKVAVELEAIRDGRELADLSEAEQLAYAEPKARFEDLLRQQDQFRQDEFKRLTRP